MDLFCTIYYGIVGMLDIIRKGDENMTDKNQFESYDGSRVFRTDFYKHNLSVNSDVNDKGEEWLYVHVKMRDKEEVYPYGCVHMYDPSEKNVPMDISPSYLTDLCKDLSKNLRLYNAGGESFIFDKRNINVYLDEDAYEEWCNDDAQIEIAELGVDRDAEYDPNFLDNWIEAQDYRFEYFEDANTGERIDIKTMKSSDFMSGYKTQVTSFISKWYKAKDLEEERLQNIGNRIKGESQRIKGDGSRPLPDIDVTENIDKQYE